MCLSISLHLRRLPWPTFNTMYRINHQVPIKHWLAETLHSHPSLCCTSLTTRCCCKGFSRISYFRENKVPQCLHTTRQDNQRGFTRFARWGEAECTSRALRGRRPRLEEASTAGANQKGIGTKNWEVRSHHVFGSSLYDKVWKFCMNILVVRREVDRCFLFPYISHKT